MISFSSMITAWPFLLGVEPGTVPFGRAFRNNLSSRDGTFKNFRPCIEKTKAVKMIKTTKSSIRFLRAINVVITKSRERGDFLVSVGGEVVQ